ncbi:hypothetical protein [Halorientalis salina]|uniref:hypothetical protein n=1 Tax=Halorientalis salina TaxID=2932266 RepID=UPI0020229DCB|nr:hypothetical protein [Halorientalis salina]
MAELKSLQDVIVGAAEKVLTTLFEPVTKVIEKHADSLVEVVVGTKHPNAVFGPPTNGAWPGIYDYYWDNTVPLALFLWAVSIGLVIFFETTSHLFSSYHRTKLKKRSFSGLLGILMWWWIAALSLRFTAALADIIVPSLSDITLFETLSFGSLGVLGTVITLSADFVLFVLIALIYLAREVVLYLFVLLMPILIALWIPGVGPFVLVSRFVSRLAGFYVPFLFMTIPVAILFRLGELLGSSVDPSMEGLGLWLTALIIPLIAVLSPLVLFWQAGAIFFVADRASHRMSASRGQKRIAKTREAGSKTKHAGRNFSRGTEGKPAATRDGQYLLDSGGSRAHSAGAQLAETSTRLRTVFDSRDGNGGNGGGGSNGGGSASQSGDAGSTDSSPTDTASEDSEQNRSSNFETLRDRDTTRTHDDDDRPRYIN